MWEWLKGKGEFRRRHPFVSAALDAGIGAVLFVAGAVVLTDETLSELVRPASFMSIGIFTGLLIRLAFIERGTRSVESP